MQRGVLMTIKGGERDMMRPCLMILYKEVLSRSCNNLFGDRSYNRGGMKSKMNALRIFRTKIFSIRYPDKKRLSRTFETASTLQ